MVSQALALSPDLQPVLPVPIIAAPVQDGVYDYHLTLFAIDESDASNYFWDEFEALERQCFWASRPSLKTMVSVAIREPEPLVDESAAER